MREREYKLIEHRKRSGLYVGVYFKLGRSLAGRSSLPEEFSNASADAKGKGRCATEVAGADSRAERSGLTPSICEYGCSLRCVRRQQLAIHVLVSKSARLQVSST
jgi:hypothetical protein